MLLKSTLNFLPTFRDISKTAIFGDVMLRYGPILVGSAYVMAPVKFQKIDVFIDSEIIIIFEFFFQNKYS